MPNRLTQATTPSAPAGGAPESGASEIGAVGEVMRDLNCPDPGEDPMTATEVLRLALPCDARAAEAARTAVRALESLGWVLDDVVLAASELVTNAVRHSGGGPEHAIVVRVTTTADQMTISIEDPGVSGRTPQLRAAADDRSGGRGLQIVARTAADWGLAPGDRSCVWARFDLGVPSPVRDGGPRP